MRGARLRRPALMGDRADGVALHCKEHRGQEHTSRRAVLRATVRCGQGILRATYKPQRRRTSTCCLFPEAQRPIGQQEAIAWHIAECLRCWLRAGTLLKS